MSLSFSFKDFLLLSLLFLFFFFFAFFGRFSLRAFFRLRVLLFFFSFFFFSVFRFFGYLVSVSLPVHFITTSRVWGLVCHSGSHVVSMK